MINAVLVFNNTGQPRLTKFYTQLVYAPPQRHPYGLTDEQPTGHRRAAAPHLRDLHAGIPQAQFGLQLPPVNRTSWVGSCATTPTRLADHYRSLPPLLAPSGNASATSTASDAPSLITYRHYATLYFIVISTSTESPLALLDLIQVFVEALDRLFENVCELDLIFNFETLHATLAEMIVGGVVVETGLDRVVEGVRVQGKVPKRPTGVESNRTQGAAAGVAMGLGRGMWTGNRWD